ncbi:hypothetical protein [Ornithinimicrobium murale]|nr:hypothetical protein [Ornithinimicrobium murale]
MEVDAEVIEAGGDDGVLSAEVTEFTEWLSRTAAPTVTISVRGSGAG